MAFVPLTDEEKRILSGEVEEPEEKSPDTGTGGLFGGINISSIPEVAEARERIERESAREPFDIPENPFAIDHSPSSPRLSAYKMLEDLPEPAESFQGAERLNMETPGGGRFVELSPQEKAIAKDSQGYSPSTLFLGKRFREAYSFGDPEAYAEDVKRSMATGIPSHLFDDPEIRQEADMQRDWQMNLDGLTKLPPALKNWLSIPGRMEIARDDISTLAQLAEILNVEDYRKNTPRIVRGYRGGEAGSEIARIRWGEIVGSTTEEDLARLPYLEEQAALNDLSEEGWVDRVVGGAGYMAGQRLRQAGGALRGALKYGLAAAGTTALLGQAGPQALLPEEVATVPAAFLLGSKIGGSLGALKEGLILETGSALDDYLKITDENGEPLPRDLAKMGALLYGVGASGLEMLQFNKLVKFVPNIGTMMTKQGVATLLKTPTIRSALMSFAKEYAGDLTFESLTEGVQQLWQLGVGEMMKNKENYRRMTEAMSPARAALEGGIGAQAAEFAKFRETTWEEIASSVGSEITSAATTFALALVPGSGTSLINNISAANRSKAMQQKFSSLGDVLQQSKLAKRFGAAVSEVIGELTKNGPIEEIGINARVFSDTLEQAGEDPAAVAKELGISEETLAEARALDGDVWVPTGTYAEKIAATELHGKIAQDIRLGGPEELTAREAETVLAKQQEDLAAAVEEAEAKIAESGEDLAAVNEVKTSLKEQLDTLGLKWLGTQASEAYSTLWANMALQASKRWGMTVKEWTDRINLTVEKDDSGAVRVVGKKKSAAEMIDGLEQSAYHGSPHRFDRFDLHKIGSGEGAQAFGWGLYFAGDKEIAEWYRKKLADNDIHSGRLVIDGKEMDWEDAIDQFFPEPAENKTLKRMGENIAQKNQGSYQMFLLQNLMPLIREKMGLPKAEYDRVDFPWNEGQLYEVDIPDGGVLLDWDKTMEEQSPAVLKILGEKGILPQNYTEETFPSQIQTLGGLIEKTESPTGTVSYRLTSPDGASFSMNWEDVQRLIGPGKGSSVYHGLLDSLGSPENVSRYLNSIGIKGIQYLDATRRSGAEGNHNYVIFDDQAVNILETYYQDAQDFKTRGPAATTPPQSENSRSKYRVSDREYLSAVEAGDMEAAQWMVDEAAREAGFTYHRYTTGLPAIDVPWMMFTSDQQSVENAYGDRHYVASDQGAIDIEELIPDITDALEEYGSSQFIRDNAESIAEELNPENIVNSAGSWDDAEVVQDVWDRVLDDRGIFKVKTADGLMVMADQDYDGNGLVKSADPIVKDDQGNVIPLSQRFDTGVKDIRYQGKGTGPQGRISFGDGEVLIQLTPKANRSTFLHETGHLFLWDLDNLVKSGRADAETLDHWRTLEGWWKDHAGGLAGWIGKSTRFSEEMRARFSGAEGEKIVREALEGRGTEENVKAVQIAAQEYFARGFEQYAMEGKSPSVELRRIFDLFRKWLTKIYSALKGVPDVELSDEVRQVMDRMVASEEAIELSELKQKSDKAALAMLGKGVDDITAREYRQAAEKAAAEAKSRLLRVLMKEMSEEGRKRVEEARRKAEGQILPELLKIPAYRVYDKLVTWLNGTGEKLSTAGLTAEQVKRIPEGMYSADGEIPLNMAADMLGLESEGELLTLLAEATAAPLGDVLKARVDQAVAGVESSMADPEVMESLAEEAILGPERMRLLSLEREILARRIRKIKGNTTIHDDRTLAAREAAMRQQAKAMILGKSMRESIAIHKFLAEAKRAAKKAFEAAVAGRLEDSLEAKDREMLYSALYLEGKLIREEAEKQQRYLKKFWAGRQRLKPLIGEENLVQIQALLERYGFQKGDQASKKTMSLHDWLKGANAQLGEDLNEQGAGIPVAEWLWEDEYKGRSKGWKELTVSEFRELHEAVKAIEHYGRSRNKLVAQAREQNLQMWKDKLQQNVLSVFGKLRPGFMDPNDKGAGPIARFLAAHDRIEFLLRRLDGFKDLGTAWQLFFKPVADAEAIEITKMKEAKKATERIFSVYTKEERRAMREKTIQTMQLDPATGKPLVLSKENVLVMLLNWGALNNREEVVFGYGFDRTVFNRGQGWIHYADMEQYWDAFRQGEMEVERLFASVLTEKDYDVAQAVWNLNESYWADVSAMVHSLTGVTPEKVEHLPVRGPNGVIYRGGYYHLAFRPESNLQSFVQSEKAAMKALYEPQGMFAMTRSGHTKARHSGPRGARLLRLDLGVEVEHLRDVIHDLYFRPVVRDLNRLLNDQQVQQTLIGSIGFESFKQFKPWVHGLANAYRAADNYGEKVVQKIMGNTSAAILGWSMTSALNQLFGWSTVVTSLGVRKTAGVILHFWSHPHQWKEMKDFAFARSPYLQDRVNSFDRDVKAAIEQITANPVKGKWTALQETFFTVAGLMDMGVSLPAWTAGYEEGIKKFNGDESKAIDYADWIVRSTQNTGAAKDLASIQRGSPMWKAMTMFYTAFGSIYNQMREQYFRGHGAKDLPRIAGFLLFQFALPALLGDILNRRGPSGDEDPEEIIEWIFTSILQEMSSTLIIVRDIVNAGTSGFDYRMSPMADAGQSIGRLMMDVGKVGKMLLGGEGPDWEKVAYHSVDVAGTFWGIPSKQILRTTRGLVGMVNDPDWSPIDLLLRKPKK